MVAVAGTVWVASSGPALYGAGPAGLWISLLAGAICLLPAVGTWLLVSWSMTRAPQWQMAATLGGFLVRMFFVLALGSSLLAASEWLRTHWVLFVGTGVVYYLAALATETVLSVLERQRRDEAPVRN